MLEKIDLSKAMNKKEYNDLAEKLQMELSKLQRDCKDLNIPIMIALEGWGASGKGTLINRLINPLDPRGFKVFTIQEASEEERLRPFLWRFWTKTPAKGRIAIFDRSWYRRVLGDRMDHITTKNEVNNAFDEIINFEKLLTADGMVIIKLFLHITKKEQKKRFNKLESSSDTSWRVTKLDWEHNKHYGEYLKINNEMLEKTDTSFAPWTIIEATNREFATIKIITTVVQKLQDACVLRRQQIAELENKDAKVSKSDQEPININAIGFQTSQESINVNTTGFQTSVLNGVDLSLTLTKVDYYKKLKKLQDKLEVLQNEMYKKRLPVILALEGWDAAGKGGAIKRLTEQMDPRGYEVIPIASPNDTEKAHHYLWRFWNSIPKAGHLTIFDRTWYGRVMVERIEGFCTEEEWKRAFNEINSMEEHLTNSGAVVIKFWFQIDKNEQKRRFKERQDTPEKQWKITAEDWRNRARWDEYEKAVDEMIVRTSTTYAPWVIVEANSKYYARIKVLETVVEALEKRLR